MNGIFLIIKLLNHIKLKSLYRIFLSIVILTFSGFLSILNAQSDISFKQISLEHGFYLSIVESIIQDQKGFMWFGTEDGLYKFTAIKNDPNNNNRLNMWQFGQKI